MADEPAFPVDTWVRYTGPRANCELSRVAPGALGRIVAHPDYGPVVRFLFPSDHGGMWLHWDIQGAVRLVLITTTPTEEELASWVLHLLSQ